MKKIIERIVKSPGSPGTNDLWLTNNNELKVYDNEEWKTIAGGSDSGDDGGGEGLFSTDVLLTGGKVVGFVDDHDYMGLTYDYNTYTLTIEREIIKPEDLLSHVKQNMDEYGYSGAYHVIYEYEPSLITLTPTMSLLIEYYYSENEGKESIIPVAVQTSTKIARAVRGGDEYIAAYIGD